MPRRRLLSQGFQYSVYAEGDSRVFKKHHSRLRALLVAARTVGPRCAVNIPLWTRDSRAFARRSILMLVSRQVDRRLLANAALSLDSLDYTQDLVVPVHRHLTGVSHDDGVRVVRSGVAFMRRLHDAYGFVDASFNLCQNFGLGPGSQLVIIDLGELLYEPSAIRAQCAARVWSSPWCLRHFPEPLRQVFVEEMDSTFATDDAQDASRNQSRRRKWAYAY